MKVSVNLLKQFGGAGLDITPDQLIERIGAQLGAVEDTVDMGKLYDGAVIAKIVSCQPLEGSDHLTVCLIDDGGAVSGVERDASGYVQVVCGAPNVRAAMVTVWLPPGSTVPQSAGKEPFVLTARMFRGFKSNGMLASLRELAVGDNHDGIAELDGAEAVPGTGFAAAYQLDDQIIDIENKMFTHRPDCFGQLGIAREVAGIANQAFTSPDWYTERPLWPVDRDNAALSVEVQIPDLCPRYMAIEIDGVRVKPSPVWLQAALTKLGVRPINNIVDITNYVMLLTAQPLHAFDFDKIAVDGQAGLVVRQPREGETLTLLDGKTLTPRPDAILICNRDQPVALGGVMGGRNSEIGESTKRIIIESANFDMYNIRRTAMEHGLFTDAVTRFTKGQSPRQCAAALYQAIMLIKQLCPEAAAVAEPIDVFNANPKDTPIEVTTGFINNRLGLSLGADEIAGLLKNVEFTVSYQNETLEITAPFWRTDVTVPEDLVEEIGRLYGYDKLPLILPQRSIAPPPVDWLLAIKGQVRSILARLGANEILSYSFVPGELIKKVNQDPDEAFQLSNALSPDLQCYRLSLTASLLEKVHPNIKAGYKEFVLFEIGKGHGKPYGTDHEDLPAEAELVEAVYAATDKARQPGAPYFVAQKYLIELINRLGGAIKLQPMPLEDNWPLRAPYEPSRSAYVFLNGRENDEPIGVVGEYAAAVRRQLKLPSACAGFSIDLRRLTSAPLLKPSYKPLPRYPKVDQDLTLAGPTSLAFQDLYDLLKNEVERNKPGNCLWELSPIDIYQTADAVPVKHFTFRLTIASFERTLTDAEVSKLLQRLADAAAAAYHTKLV